MTLTMTMSDRDPDPDSVHNHDDDPDPAHAIIIPDPGHDIIITVVSKTITRKSTRIPSQRTEPHRLTLLTLPLPLA